MQRLVCIVEGEGEVQALPNLCARILRELKVEAWFVDKEPIRRPRSQLVEQRMRSPSRLCHQQGLQTALGIALARRPGAVLVVCDSDDDCPGPWASSVPRVAGGSIPVGAVMAVREFEAWLLWSRGDDELKKARIANPDRIRGAKQALERLVQGYDPVALQLELTRQIDISRLRQRSRSFDKLVRTLGTLCRAQVPPWPPSTR